MPDDTSRGADQPDIVLMLKEGLPIDIESEIRTQLERSGLNLIVIHHPGGPYAGMELYLPTAITLFVTAGFFNGILQELGKDVYVTFKNAAFLLWMRANKLKFNFFGSTGKLSPTRRYSMSYSIISEVTPGLLFKFIIQTEMSADDAESGIEAFINLIDNVLNDRLSEADLAALLTYKPVGKAVLVTFDSTSRTIVPVNAFTD